VNRSKEVFSLPDKILFFLIHYTEQPVNAKEKPHI